MYNHIIKAKIDKDLPDALETMSPQNFQHIAEYFALHNIDCSGLAKSKLKLTLKLNQQLSAKQELMRQYGRKGLSPYLIHDFDNGFYFGITQNINPALFTSKDELVISEKRISLNKIKEIFKSYPDVIYNQMKYEDIICLLNVSLEQCIDATVAKDITVNKNLSVSLKYTRPLESAEKYTKQLKMDLLKKHPIQYFKACKILKKEERGTCQKQHNIVNQSLDQSTKTTIENTTKTTIEKPSEIEG